MAKYKGTKITSPIGRASFPAVFTPKLKYQSDDQFEYSIDVLFDKGTDLKPFKAKCDEALSEVYGADRGKWPKNISYPMTDQEVMIDKLEAKGQTHDHLVAGASYIRFKTNATNAKPIVVDEQMNEIIDPTKIYGGCYVRVSTQIKVNPIKSKDPVTKKETLIVYVTPYLQGVQFIKDGDSFGGRPSVSDMFEPVVFEDEEQPNILG